MAIRDSFTKRMWLVANATERAAIESNASEVGTFCWQEDTSELYVLTAVGPTATWAEYASSADVTAAVATHAALGMGVHGLVRAVKGSDQTTTDAGAPYQNVDGTELALASGGTYSFRYLCVFQSVALTTGIKLALIGPSQDMLAIHTRIPVSASAEVAGYTRAYQSGVIGTGVDVVDSNLLAIVEGVIHTTAAGNLQLRFATEVGGSTVTVKAGTTGEALRFA